MKSTERFPGAIVCEDLPCMSAPTSIVSLDNHRRKSRLAAESFQRPRKLPDDLRLAVLSRSW
jgi:hypothetical protein